MKYARLTTLITVVLRVVGLLLLVACTDNGEHSTGTPPSYLNDKDTNTSGGVLAF